MLACVLIKHRKLIEWSGQQQIEQLSDWLGPGDGPLIWPQATIIIIYWSPPQSSFHSLVSGWIRSNEWISVGMRTILDSVDGLPSLNSMAVDLMALVEIIPEKTECDNKFPWAVCDWRSGLICGQCNAAFYLGTCCKYSYLFGAANQYVPSRVQETRQFFTSANGLMFIDLNVSSRSMSQPVIGK